MEENKQIIAMSQALDDAYRYIDELSDKNEDLSTRNAEMMFYIAELQKQLYEANMRAETLYRHLLLQQDRKNIVEVE